MKSAGLMFRVLVVLAMVLAYGNAYAGHQFTIAIMQDEQGAGKKYRPLQTYLAGKGIDFSFIAATNYTAAAEMFASGKVDAMFSGSAVAGIFIMKELATPLVRPVSTDGVSTYSAVIIAPKGSPKYSAKADYFKGKRVIFPPLASSGEIYYRSIPNIKSAGATMQKAASHGAAIDALSGGGADVAIVKNRIWDRQKGKYPNLVLVGRDTEENPDSTLIVSNKADAETAAKVKAALLALRDDMSPQTQEVRKAMDIQGYVETSKGDFKHTMELLQRAGVKRSFAFEFQ
jgi:ABC-type phosphate/phosphonate transport system substrate-binding protein